MKIAKLTQKTPLMFQRDALKNFHYQTKQCLKSYPKKAEKKKENRRIKIDKSKC